MHLKLAKKINKWLKKQQIATGNLINNKIADKITKVSKVWQQNSLQTLKNDNERSPEEVNFWKSY